jgi:hypothetical protein
MSTPDEATTNSSDTAGLVYGPVGHCIYCGASDVHLGREHVMPFGLHGQMVLLKSSCDSCAKVTGQLENFVLGRMLVDLRIRYGMKSRKKSRNQRPTEFEWQAENVFSKAKRKRRVGSDYLPWLSWTLPVYDLPGLLLQRAPEECHKGFLRSVISQLDASAMLSIGNGVESVKAHGTPVNLVAFNRFLAKVAHSFTCATLGEDNFEPCLNKLILEGHEHSTFWIGCDEERSAQPYFFEIEPGEYQAWNGQKFLAVRIRLFSFLGTPSYVIAVGTRRCDEERLLQQPIYRLNAKVLIKDADGVPIFSCGI